MESYDSKIKTVYFIRHGEATHNVDYEEVGDSAYFAEKHRDSRLTSRGILQALLVKAPNVDIVFTSPLTRTLMTANLIFKYHPKVIATDIIRETNYQHVCNNRQTRNELIQKYNDIQFNEITEEDEQFILGHDDTITRFEQLDQLITSQSYDNIAIVSHHTFLHDYFVYKGYNKIELKNCELVKSVYSNNKLINIERQ